MDQSERAGVCFRGIKYAPLPSQAKFHRSDARFKGFSGPIGSGKSQALCQEAIKLSYVNAGRVGLIGAPTYPMLRDATLATLFEIMDANLIPYEYSKGDNVLTMTDTTSRVLCRSVDEFERLRGTNLAWFALDELTYTPEAAWLVLEGRLRDPRAQRLCGFAVWTPKGFDWVYRKFISEPRRGYETTLAKPFENRHLLYQIPDFYDLLKSSYDEAFFQQEALGKYLNVQAGLVYYAFSRQEHVTDIQVQRCRFFGRLTSMWIRCVRWLRRSSAEWCMSWTRLFFVTPARYRRARTFSGDSPATLVESLYTETRPGTASTPLERPTTTSFASFSQRTIPTVCTTRFLRRTLVSAIALR